MTRKRRSSQIKKRGTGILYVLKYGCLIFFSIIAFFPIYWLIVTSIKIPKHYFTFPPMWIPLSATWDHYLSLQSVYQAFPFFKNSLIIALGNTTLVLVAAIPAAYAIARYRTGGQFLSFWILFQRMLPPVATAIPLFIVYVKIGLIDSYSSLIMGYVLFNLPFAVWMLIGFFEGFPGELQDQAMVDGCTEIGSLIRIVLPLIMPGVVVTALFCFIYSWNELLFALAFTRRNAATAPVLLTSILHSPTGLYFGETAATAVVAIIPTFTLTMFLQRYIVRGLTLGGIKG